ncbi:MAG: hypothetical protein GY832_01520 [Chloroflexi bacterium]|nr:hypothetical protein [Chloroflexota bacterium]
MAKSNSSTNVVYKPIPGFDGYRVGDDGSVWSHKRSKCRLLKLGASRGYLHVGLCIDGEGHTRKVHHLVLTAFVGPRPAGKEACHGNGCRTDNRLVNLRWDSPAANRADRHGADYKVARGEPHVGAKPTEANIREIRRRYAAGGITYKMLAKEYQVCPGTIGMIIRRRTWKHVA